MLYPGLSDGGFVVVEDCGGQDACRRAVTDYRDSYGISSRSNRSTGPGSTGAKRPVCNAPRGRMQTATRRLKSTAAAGLFSRGPNAALSLHSRASFHRNKVRPEGMC
jgi:hypothetical protein